MIGDIVKVDAHRPWPLPCGPWVMAQTWRDLLFAHWPIPATAMRALVPPALALDTFAGEAWIGVVPFAMRTVRPRLLPPLPWLSYFPELNVRTYVRVRDQGIDKAGVYFFSLDAANPVAVAIARAGFRLPYFRAQMKLTHTGNEVAYRSRRTHAGAPGAEFAGRYRPVDAVFRAQPGSLEEWLTERYSLYTVDRRGRPYIGEIHHAPWPLQPATADLPVNTMAGAAAIRLPALAPLVQFVRQIDVVVWALRAVV